MNVSVVIPSLNSEGEIERALASLKPQLIEGDEIIIVDGGSKDRTLEIANKYGCKIFIYPEASLGQSRDFGVSQSGNEIIVQTDTDIEMIPGFMDILRRYFEENPDLAGVSCGWRDGKGRAMGKFCCGVLEGIMKYADCIFSYRKSVYYAKTQGHPNVSFGEQIGLWLQIQRAGPTIYDPNLYVYHFSDAQVSIPSYLIGGSLLGIGAGYEGIIGGAVGMATMGLGGGFLAGQAGVDILKKIPSVQKYWAGPHLHHYHIGLMILAATMAFSSELPDDVAAGLYGLGGGLALHDLLTEPTV